MQKKVAIIQSNYIPWKGYFDIINMADEFVLYDDVQYTRRDWRNRNKIKINNNLQWLTIPVEVKTKYFQLIKDTKIADNKWMYKHLQSIRHNYSKAKYYDEYISIFEKLYRACEGKIYLSDVNFTFIRAICDILNIKTQLSWSMDYLITSTDNTEKLLEICKKSNATEYISGPTAKSYLNLKLFEEANIKLTWMDYSGYREYDQLYPPFEHGVSIIDMIFNTGKYAYKYMKSFGA